MGCTLPSNPIPSPGGVFVLVYHILYQAKKLLFLNNFQGQILRYNAWSFKVTVEGDLNP